MLQEAYLPSLHYVHSLHLPKYQQHPGLGIGRWIYRWRIQDKDI